MDQYEMARNAAVNEIYKMNAGFASLEHPNLKCRPYYEPFPEMRSKPADLWERLPALWLHQSFTPQKTSR